MEKEQIRSVIYSKIDELPTLPTVVPRVLSLLEDPSADAGKLTEVVSHDPAMTSKILKVANSAYYGFPQKITSLERAVALLGFNMVKSLALSVGVIKSLPSPKLAGLFEVRGLWVHSLAVATAMRQLAEQTGKFDDIESLFIIGLLHDLGKVLLGEFFPDEFARALEQAAVDPAVSLDEAERKTIGLDHGQVGGMLLSRWKFPAAIVSPVSSHHMADSYPTDYSDQKGILMVADSLALELGIGDAGNRAPVQIQPSTLEALELEEGNLEQARRGLIEGKEGIEGFFQALE